MADCSTQFTKFLSNIELTDTQIENLKKNREGLRSTIKQYFKNEGLSQPIFCWQGSFSMGTIIKDPENEYDFDDGVYLTHLPENKTDWPNTEKIHDLIVDAVKNHTTQDVQNKKKCVRVPYSDKHHVDLAIYGQDGDKYYLAVKGNTQWEENSAKAFKDWFDSKKKQYGTDFSNVIKTIKKWVKKQGYEKISGFYITILVGNNFSSNSRFDLCLKNTLSNILLDLKNSYKIVRPVEPRINLTEEKFSTAEDFKKSFIDPFQDFYDIAKNAVNDESKNKATKRWASLFGTDFPIYQGESKKKSDYAYNITSTPQPWGINLG